MKPVVSEPDQPPLMFHLSRDDTTDRIECVRKGDRGACICGRGATVLEAIGDWYIQTGQAVVDTSPQIIQQHWRISPKVRIPKVKVGPDRRD